MSEELIAALKRELELQWGYSHEEHCGCPCDGTQKRCHWPRPRILDVKTGDPVPEDEDKRPYMRESA